MKLSDFRNLDTSNPGAWPSSVKYVVALLVIALIVAAGWYFKISDQRMQLQNVEREELTLRGDFEKKQAQVVNLDAYREQLAEMDEMFRQMVRQLPSKTEMPQLLIDISQAALTSGIDTQLFEPGAERPQDFYAEQPITIRMVGSYHQFGEFVSRIAQLPRVVILTMHDIELRPQGGAASGNRRGRAGATAPPMPSGALTMSGTVRTYRYLDEQEQAQLAEAAEAAQAQGRRR